MSDFEFTPEARERIRERIRDHELAFASELRRWREEAGLSQTRLSLVIGQHQTTMARIEAGTQALRYGAAVELIAFFGQPINLPGSVCHSCYGHPPHGFTCNACGAGGDGRA